MRVLAFSFYDGKSGLFSQPFYAVARGVAVRMALEVGSDSSTSIGRHPGDFTLFEIGAFDDNLGQFENANPPINLGLVASLIVRPDDNLPLLRSVV